MLDGKPVTIFGDGEQTRDYVFAGDVVRANVAALNSPASGIALNVGTGIETNVNQLYSTLSAIADFPAKAEYDSERPGEQRRSVISPARAASTIGWRPEKSLGDGLEATFKYFKDNRGRRH
jgi:UDP-glucose 4-epimerase